MKNSSFYVSGLFTWVPGVTSGCTLLSRTSQCLGNFYSSLEVVYFLLCFTFWEKQLPMLYGVCKSDFVCDFFKLHMLKVKLHSWYINDI